MARNISRRRFITGSGAVFGAAALAHLLPEPLARYVGSDVWAPPAEAAVRLDPGDPLANFTQEGNQAFATSPTILTLKDNSNGDIINFFARDADAGPATDVDIVVNFQVRAFTLNNADSGVRFTVNDGQSRSAIAECIVDSIGVMGIGLAGGTTFADPLNYPMFVAVDWTAPVTFRMRRYANGDSELIEVNGVAPDPRALLPATAQPGQLRAFPTFEFGCASAEALATGEFTQFFSERAVTAFASMTAAARLRLGPRANDDAFGLGIRFTLGAGSDGIAPLAEAVTVGLGTLHLTIPAGSFKPGPFGSFVFQGVIDGIGIGAAIRPVSGGTYDFAITGNGADLTGTTNPVPVSLVVGNDGGSTSIMASFSK